MTAGRWSVHCESKGLVLLIIRRFMNILEIIKNSTTLANFSFFFVWQKGIIKLQSMETDGRLEKTRNSPEKRSFYNRNSRESTMVRDSESIQHCNTPAVPVCPYPSDTSSFTVLTFTDPEARHGRCRSWHEIPSFVGNSRGFFHRSAQITASTLCIRLHFSLRPRRICDIRETSIELTARVAHFLTRHGIRAVHSDNFPINFSRESPLVKTYSTSARDGSCNGNAFLNQLLWLSADSCWHLLPTTRTYVYLVCISIFTVQTELKIFLK
jgi:hypothetical protein